MSLISKIVEETDTGFGRSSSSNGLASIRQPDCAAAIWHRSMDESTKNWLDGLDPCLLPQARLVLRPANVEKSITDICEISGTPDCRQREWFIEDVTHLAIQFADLMNSAYLRLRFDVERTNACRKFHIDAVTARLVCTYRGKGTQYGIAEHDGEPSLIQTVPTGAPILLRGTAWPGAARPKLLHRSPPIEGTGQTRLLLVLDPLSERTALRELAAD